MIELLDHNKDTYNRLCLFMQDNSKCALIQATGTGKSYIAGKYIEEHANTALIIVPTNAIADAWSDLFSDSENIDIVTYQAFARDPNNYIDYDLIIADEMHHLGSEVWGKKFVETYLQSENHKIIGLTATEIRYLDNSRDMSEEIFDNLRIDGCDLPTAINNGILPTFKYVSALYCDEKDFDEWKEKAGKIKDIKTQKELKGRLDVCIKNMVSVKQAVDENLTEDYKKIIVFLNNVESKETALKMLKDVFPNASFYDVDYSKSDKENRLQINSFSDDSNRAVLFAVDMLNEGVHVKGADCVIMFRKTKSPQIYLQQLGRVLSSSSKKSPIVFDFVSNINNIESRKQSENQDKELQNFIDRINSGISKEKIIVKNYSLEIENILNEISLKASGRAWTKDEDNFLKENFKNMNYSEISKQLNRTIYAICTRVNDLGLVRNKKLTDEEKQFLISNSDMKHSEIAEQLGITVKRVQRERNKLGITNTYKSDEIRKYIIENYNTPDDEKEIAEMFGIKEKTVRLIAVKLGKRKRQEYSKEEIEFVKENYQKMKVTDIAKRLERTPNSVRIIATKLGLKKQHRKIVQLDFDMNFISSFDSLKQASDKIGIERASTSISLCTRGKAKTAYGYKWLYEEDYLKMIAEGGDVH